MQLHLVLIAFQLCAFDDFFCESKADKRHTDLPMEFKAQPKNHYIKEQWNWHAPCSATLGFFTFSMDLSIFNFNQLLLFNLLLLSCLVIYLATKIKKHRSTTYLIASLIPLVAFQLGSYLFGKWPNSPAGAQLIILAAALVPVTIVPVSHIVGRTPRGRRQAAWIAYYVMQLLLLAFFLRSLSGGGIIEWVTGILEQPIIIIDSSWRYYFLNVVGSSVLALMCFDTTLQRANKPEQDQLKFVLIAFLGFAVYFSYLSINILLASYISQAIIQLGAAIVLLGLILLGYSFAKYPLWNVKIRVSRHVVFGSLTATAAAVYLIISGTILELLRWLEPQGLTLLVPIAAFALVVLFLVVYLSPKFHSSVKSFITRNFFRNKYDYRDLWMKFSEKSSGSLNVRDVLPQIAEFVTDAMFVQQVAFWLRCPTSDTYQLAYCQDPAAVEKSGTAPLHVERPRGKSRDVTVYNVPKAHKPTPPDDFPVHDIETLNTLGIRRVVLVEKNREILAVMGIGAQTGQHEMTAEDNQFLSSVSNQLGHLILTHKLSEELLLSREWDSFNRFASFILHDLKNLATLQGMTLDNAKHLSHNPNFISDAFTTFTQTTEKMISLIASLSVQRGQFSLKQQPVNILEVISNTFDHLKIQQRNGLQLRTMFPNSQLPAVSGDPELLQKAFTNLLLNAIQSLPKGEGAVEVTVSNDIRGKITASIRDTGCGIPPERLGNLFRPFQTTKEKGLGIGLCHTRSIIEVHGGHIRIESQLNEGTKVEVELPTL
jgi:putative PEP-CTERM system histidine kinase